MRKINYKEFIKKLFSKETLEAVGVYKIWQFLDR